MCAMCSRIALTVFLALVFVLSSNDYSFESKCSMFANAQSEEELAKIDQEVENGHRAEAAPSVIRNISEFFIVQRLKGIMKWQYLHMAEIENPENDWHSCYFVRCEGNQCPEAPYNTQQVNTKL